MARKLTTAERDNYNSFHIPNCNRILKRKTNAIHVSKANSYEHEIKKCEVAVKLIQEGNLVVTESQENSSKLIRDVVDLTTGDIYEIVYRHEKDEEILEYRKGGVIPVIVNPMICSVCKMEYPKRKKKDICQICTKAGEQ